MRGCQSHIANDVFLSQRESAAFESARGVARCALDGSGREAVDRGARGMLLTKTTLSAWRWPRNILVIYIQFDTTKQF